MAPVLYARRDRGREIVRVYCPHCRKDHLHAPEGIVDGSNPHRIAHCADPRSPYAATGYVLRLAVTMKAEGWGNA